VRGFPSYEAANALLDTWVKERPSELRRHEIGHSYEHRPIHAYVLAANASESQGRPKVLLTSLMHAREPASLTVLLNFIGRLLELYASGDPEATSTLRARELWLVPFVNPDGYVENERLLAAGVPDGAVLVRKNRRPTCDSSVDGGVDLNRNFGVHWKDTFEPC
jgi:murein tripeptide amidase MpaA